MEYNCQSIYHTLNLINKLFTYLGFNSMKLIDWVSDFKRKLRLVLGVSQSVLDLCSISLDGAWKCLSIFCYVYSSMLVCPFINVVMCILHCCYVYSSMCYVCSSIWWLSVLIFIHLFFIFYINLIDCLFFCLLGYWCLW